MSSITAQTWHGGLRSEKSDCLDPSDRSDRRSWTRQLVATGIPLPTVRSGCLRRASWPSPRPVVAHPVPHIPPMTLPPPLPLHAVHLRPPARHIPTPRARRSPVLLEVALTPTLAVSQCPPQKTLPSPSSPLPTPPRRRVGPRGYPVQQRPAGDVADRETAPSIPAVSAISAVAVRVVSPPSAGRRPGSPPIRVPAPSVEPRVAASVPVSVVPPVWRGHAVVVTPVGVASALPLLLRRLLACIRPLEPLSNKRQRPVVVPPRVDPRADRVRIWAARGDGV